MIASLKGSLMLFHYGNCKSKIRELESQVVMLLGQIEELKAIYNYQVGALEKEITELSSKATSAEMSLAGKTCVLETMEKENNNLNQIISRKDDEIKELKNEVANVLNISSGPEWLHKKSKKKK